MYVVVVQRQKKNIYSKNIQKSDESSQKKRIRLLSYIAAEKLTFLYFDIFALCDRHTDGQNIHWIDAHVGEECTHKKFRTTYISYRGQEIAFPPKHSEQTDVRTFVTIERSFVTKDYKIHVQISF